MGGIRRRRLLKIAVGMLGASVAGVAITVLACNRRDATLSTAGVRLAIALEDMVEPARIGRAYRAQVGRAAIEATVLSQSVLVEAARIGCPATRRAQLRAAMRADFSTGEIVLADRLVVSRTEALIAGFLYGKQLV